MVWLQKPMFDVPDPGWRAPTLSSLPSLRDAKRIAVDTETYDPQLRDLGPGVRRGGFVAGISLAVEDGPSFYLPIAHGGDEAEEVHGNMSRDQVLAWLRDEAKNFTGTVVGMNLPYDLDYLAELDVVFRRAEWFRDVSVAAVLLDELQREYSLNAILRRAGMPGKEESGLEHAARAWCLHPKSDMWRMPAKYVAEYAIADVELPLKLLRRQERQIEEQELERVWDLESRVLPVTVKIRRRGVRIDEDRLSQVERWALGEEQKFLSQVRHATGVEITTESITKKEPIAMALAQIGVRLPLTATGQPDTKASTLEAVDHDVGRWIVRAKKFHKMRCDFGGAIRRHMVRGRIHSTFRQIKGGIDDGKDGDEKGAAYGRFSSTDPNLQQQYNPEKEPEISGEWRQIYVPEEDAYWAACDYSAQEPRWTVHYANVTGCKGAAEMVAKYLENPRLDLHSETALLCREPFDALGMVRDRHRKNSKGIFLGLCYGMGGAKLCDELGLPTTWWSPRGSAKKFRVAGEEGQKLLAGFNLMVPFVKQLATMCENRARKMGFVRTHSGRKCRFPVDERRSTKDKIVFDWAHKALNRVIQGSSGDQGKEALVAADAAGFYVQIPVHDELDGSVADRAEGERLCKLMEEVVQVSVPMIVDLGFGSSWGDAV